MSRTRTLWHAGLLLVLLPAACRHPENAEIDQLTCLIAEHPRDVTPPPVVAEATPPTRPAPSVENKSGLKQTAFTQVRDEQRTKPPSLLQIPPDLPFANEPLPEGKLLPQLRPLGPNPEPLPGPSGRPMTLPELEQTALATNPAIKQAAANVVAARGAYLQAGLHPNPSIGYEADTVNTSGSPGFQGGFLDQPIKTAGKLQLGRDVAEGDLRNQEIALRKAEADLLAQVRGNYFAVLVAQENMKVSLALAQFSDNIYRAQVELVKAGQAAAYEPYQLRVLAFQTRAALVQSRNRYVSAWKQLAASVGLSRDSHPVQLAGRVDMPIPIYQYEAVLNQVLAQNTDVLTARTTLARARANVGLARANGFPDLDARVVLQEDYTTPPHQRFSYSIQFGGPLPIWDRNQGNIQQAEAQLVSATEEEHRVRLDLMTRLDDAFERYEDNRVLLEYYRTHILADQVRAYRSIYERHRTEPANPNSPNPPPSFGDVVQAQQTLVTTVTGYVTALGNLWQAVVDVAHLLQTDDLYGPASSQCVTPVPDLEALLCVHPCSPLQGPNPLEAPPNWPPADPAMKQENGKKE